jgi:transposase
MLWRRGRAYSQDLRERVFAAADEGDRVGRIAERLRVSVSYVSKVLSRRRRTGLTTALAQRCHVPSRLAERQTAIESQVTTSPDATITELRAWLSRTHQVSASTGLMWKTLAALDLTLKKKSLRAAEQDRPDVAKARTEWRERQPSLTLGKLVFIDETWTRTNMTRRYGRAPRGKRRVDAVPPGLRDRRARRSAGRLCLQIDRREALSAPFEGPAKRRCKLAQTR